MKTKGPLLEQLTHRLAECPAEFLAEPKLGGKGVVHVDAVVSDLLRDLGGTSLNDDEAGRFVLASKSERNRLRLVLIAAWLLRHEWFCQVGCYAESAKGWLGGGFDGLPDLVVADLFVRDPDRREELARLCLTALSLRPAGENEAQAADRLKTLSCVERNRVVQESREQVQRARELREAMKKKAAEEAAAKVVGE